MAGDPDAVPSGEGVPDVPYASLEDALIRAVSAPPWWRRWLTRGRVASVLAGGPGTRRLRNRAMPVAAALAAVLALSLLGITSPWDSGTTPARDDDPLGLDGSAPLSPTASSDDQRSIVSRPETSQAADQPSCPAPLSVVTAPDISDAVRELAGPLANDPCPQVRVTPEAPATTLSTLAIGDAAVPDVWVPDSSLWLGLAHSGGSELPATGTSIARTPVVLAVPEPVGDQLAGEGVWPVWLVFYDKVTTGEIPRMSVAGPETTVGALTLVAFAEAAEYHWGDDGEGAPFLHTIHFRDSLAATDADPEALLDRLTTTPAAQSATQVGVFPVTEQRLLAYQNGHPGMPVVAYGTHEAMSEADYPAAVSRSLDGRRADIADELVAQLRSPAAVQRLVELGFRPPRGSSTQPAALADPNRFPDYPDPVSLPDPAGWRSILDTWTWSG